MYRGLQSRLNIKSAKIERDLFGMTNHEPDKRYLQSLRHSFKNISLDACDAEEMYIIFQHHFESRLAMKNSSSMIFDHFPEGQEEHIPRNFWEIGQIILRSVSEKINDSIELKASNFLLTTYGPKDKFKYESDGFLVIGFNLGSPEVFTYDTGYAGNRGNIKNSTCITANNMVLFPNFRALNSNQEGKIILRNEIFRGKSIRYSECDKTGIHNRHIIKGENWRTWLLFFEIPLSINNGYLTREKLNELIEKIGHLDLHGMGIADMLNKAKEHVENSSS